MCKLPVSWLSCLCSRASPSCLCIYFVCMTFCYLFCYSFCRNCIFISCGPPKVYCLFQFQTVAKVCSFLLWLCVNERNMSQSIWSIWGHERMSRLESDTGVSSSHILNSTYSLALFWEILLLCLSWQRPWKRIISPANKYADMHSKQDVILLI